MEVSTAKQGYRGWGLSDPQARESRGSLSGDVSQTVGGKARRHGVGEGGENVQTPHGRWARAPSPAATAVGRYVAKAERGRSRNVMREGRLMYYSEPRQAGVAGGGQHVSSGRDRT